MELSTSKETSLIEERNLLERFVTENRCRLVTATFSPTQAPLCAEALQTFCNAALRDLRERFAPLVATGKISVREHNAKGFYGDGEEIESHVFLIAEFMDSGDRYLIDTTFIQFFHQNWRQAQPKSGWAAEAAGFLPSASQLLEQGYIAIENDDIPRMHSVALGMKPDDAAKLKTDIYQKPSSYQGREDGQYLERTQAKLAPEASIAGMREKIPGLVRAALEECGILSGKI